MTVSTPNYHWSMPDPGGSANTWGSLCNGVFTAIDTSLWNINANTATFAGGMTTNGFTNTNGYTVSQASGNGNASFVLNNSAGATDGVSVLEPAANIVALINQTGSGSLYINADGSVSTSGTFNTQSVTAADVTCSSVACSGNGSFSGQFNTVGSIHSGGSLSGTGLISRPGVSGTSDFSIQYNFNWDGARNNLWVNGSNWGQIQTNSDYRMKKDVEPLGSMWGTVKALNPVSYTHKDWSPPASKNVRIAADDVERWGFLAHELQETLVESAATGVKDDPVHVQAPNPFAVIAALTRALQEAMMRIEALEAAR